MLLKIAAALLMFTAIVVIHEFGHFVIARLFKVGVPVFSVGMGPRAFGVRWGDTDYRVSWFPLGGYCQMAGADPFGEEDPDAYVDPDEDFMGKPVWQRLLIMVAGPGFNLALPVLIFGAMLMIGAERGDAVIGSVVPESPAAVAGLQLDDRIVAVNHRDVDLWDEFQRALERQPEGPIHLTVERGSDTVAVTFPAGTLDLTGNGDPDLESLGIRWSRVSTRIGVDDPNSPAARAGLIIGDGIETVDGVEVETWIELMAALDGDRHDITWRRAEDPAEESPDDDDEGVASMSGVLQADPDWQPRDGDPHANRWGLVPVNLFVGAYTEDSAAADAGLELDDRILSVDGQTVHAFSDLYRIVKGVAPETAEPRGFFGKRPDPPEPDSLALTVVRRGEVIDLSLRPRMTRQVGLKVYWRPLIGIVRYPDAYVGGARTFKRYSVDKAIPEAARMTVEVVTGSIGVLAEFLTRERRIKETVGGPIAIFSMAARSAQSGLAEFAQMMAMISIGVGIINLLPVPVLDGGQILFYAIEGVRGRPLSIALRERIQMIGVLFLVALFVVVTVNDVSRVIGGG